MTTVSDIFSSLAVIAFCFVIGFGFTNKVVIFFDRNDYGRTLLLVISCAFFYMLMFGIDTPSTATKYFYTPIIGLVCIVLLLDSIILSTRHNGGNILFGILIAVSKALYILITIVLVAFLVLPSRDKDGHVQRIRTLLGFVAAGGVTYLSFMLINGDKVTQANHLRKLNGE